MLKLKKIENYPRTAHIFEQEQCYLYVGLHCSGSLKKMKIKSNSGMIGLLLKATSSELHLEKTNILQRYAKTKTHINFAVTAKLISAFVFTTGTVHFFYFLNQKFPASSCLLCLYSQVFVGPGPEVIKHFSSSAQLSMKFQLLINDEIIKIGAQFRFKTQKLVIYPAHKC